jgi:hypothetical protein
MTDDLTQEEQSTIKDAVFGAIALVSKADPGFFATFKESLAGSKVLGAAPAAVQDLFKAGGFPSPLRGTPEEVQAAVTAKLQEAVATLEAKRADTVQGFRDVVLAAVDAVAAASNGISAAEQAVLDRVKSALGAPRPT